MKSRWKTFEEQARDIASRLHSKPCYPGRIAGEDIDGIIDIDPENKVLIEITTNFTLDKVRSDINKLVLARNSLFGDGILSKSFVVLENEPSNAMTEGGEGNRVAVISVNKLADRFIEYDRYRVARQEASFGSAVDPNSGEKDRIAYIPVQYIERPHGKEHPAKDIAKLLLNGTNVALLGEFGTGKSRCISEVFSILSAEWRKTFVFPFAVNLRECWGLRRAEEIVRRSVNSLGLDDLASSAVRALSQRNSLFLLDGFDEIGTQSWSADDARLRRLRAQALEGAKDIVQNSSYGTLITGREHYFSSHSEMFSALGLLKDNTAILYAKDEFSLQELGAYFSAASIDVTLPEWLPRRPLICQTIAQLEADELDRMFGTGSLEAVFWNHFIEVVCKRDARINVSFDASKIYDVFVELARKTRNKAANVGPISYRELQEAFEVVVGQLPVEEASVMLQRLPSLGRVGPESSDRRFIDMYILDGLRARDVARILDGDEARRRKALEESWANPLDILGQKVLAYELRSKIAPSINFVKRASAHKNGTLAGDVTGALLRTGSGELDFLGSEIRSAPISELDLSSTNVIGMNVVDSIIDKVILPSFPPKKTTIVRCDIGKVVGVGSISGLPSWIQPSSVDEFDTLQTVARIRNAGLSIQHEILVAIIKKTFFQRGSGRKEEALLRGFGSGPSQGLAPKVLNLLLRESILTKFRGKEGQVYTPVRAAAGRMRTMLDELRSSTDELWTKVGQL